MDQGIKHSAPPRREHLCQSSDDRPEDHGVPEGVESLAQHQRVEGSQLNEGDRKGDAKEDGRREEAGEAELGCVDRDGARYPQHCQGEDAEERLGVGALDATTEGDADEEAEEGEGGDEGEEELAVVHGEIWEMIGE